MNTGIAELGLDSVPAGRGVVDGAVSPQTTMLSAAEMPQTTMLSAAGMPQTTMLSAAV